MDDSPIDDRPVDESPVDDEAHQLLEDLKQAIADLEEGHGDRHRLVALAEDVEHRFRSNDDDPDDDSLGDDLQKAAVRFDVEHPGLSQSLRRIMDALGAGGL